MDQQTVIWTALPNGISEENKLRLSVLVSPRLKSSGTNATLAQFPDFLDWPQANLSFNVLFENGPSVAAKVIGIKPCSQRWKALFKPSTYVKPYIFDELSNQEVISYPVQKTFSRIKKGYTVFAKEFPTDFPDFMLPNPTNLSMLTETVSINRLEELKKFHQPQLSSALAPENDPEELDFHQIISMIGDFPFIMRKLGLILDLEIPLTDDIPDNSTIQIIPLWKVRGGASQNLNIGLNEQQFRDDICPKTHYVKNKKVSQFSAANKNAETKIENGVLKLDDTDTFAVMQVDVDGIGIKLLDFINNLVDLKSNKELLSEDSPTSYALPNMRSAGLSLVQSKRNEQLTQSLKNSSDLNENLESGANLELFAEDLIRGYRIDVLDSKNKWYSLCKRLGTYHFLDDDVTLSNPDEGFISLGATSIDDKLRLHESLVTWGGWSLVVPPIESKRRISRSEEIVETEFKLKTTFSVPPKSLPRLRFGESYQLRARVVDLAGNSIGPEGKTDDCCRLTPSVRYKRFEPINSPVVALQKDAVGNDIPMTPGESIERMVIRSSNHKPLLKNSCKRIISVPMVSQKFAEAHGKIDKQDGSLDKNVFKSIVNGPNFLPSNDPLARGAAILGLPVPFSQEPTKIPFTDTNFTLEITEGPNKISWKEETRLLTIYIPRAEVFKFKLSSYLDPKDLELMGIWGWLEEEDLQHTTLTTLRNNALDGKMWMITPYREITLVHAVQQPLITPQFQKLTAEKDLNASFVTLKDTFMIDGKSTSKLEVVAEWKELKDKDFSKNTLGENLNSDNEMNDWKSCAIDPITIDEKQTWITLNHQHSFPDTKHRVVKYKAIATSRFSEYFYECNNEKITFRGTNDIHLTHKSLVYGTEKVHKSEKSVQYVRDKDYKIDYIKGTICRTTCSEIKDNEKLCIEYQFLPVETNCESHEISINILNSARPVAPKILYVLPTFEWEEWDEQATNKRKVVNRKASGLRVYLDQPLTSSGEGELLGVVLQSCNNTQISDQLKPYVTQWGKDIIWESNSFPALPRLENFKKSRETDVGLSLLGIDNETVNVAGHSVEYNQKRNLWFCDIEIDSGNSYFPFVSLALASYQPNSVPDAHLSQVVMADFVQVAPDRLATVMKNPSDRRIVNISLCGTGPGFNHLPQTMKNEVEASVEKRNLNNQWVPVLGSTSLLHQTELDTPRKTWMGQVILPDIPSSSNKYRIVIKEFECFLIDGDSPDTTDMTRRLVYASTLEV
ncbi:hypothetical protein CN582_24875 [Bacillus wiedmannii]|uniref:hypothetical protein n=1 Tax=Bacillus wiedmannii TaxID=1890302 RepID=UPI000BF5A4D7|nr:hypothetical protein [Bacillus wiedmannii]PEP92382.1 hypothetical protein CN582_24875 [Bacillus wiedmannii]